MLDTQPEVVSTLQKDLYSIIDTTYKGYNSRWHNTNESQRPKMALECREQLLKFAFDIIQREDARAVGYEVDLQGMRLLFNCLRKLDVYKYMKEGSEDALLKAFPHLAQLEAKV